MTSAETTAERPRLLILYGSQTGCAADMADRVRREAKRRHFRPALFAMDEYDRAQLVNERLAIFVCSTTGQGEEPDNMKKFWRFLMRKDLPKGALAQLRFAVFGLGDSSYEKFNYPGKKLHKRLMQLGAQPYHPRGDGDDQHYLGQDGALDPWLDGVWNVLMQAYPLPAGLSALPDDVLYPWMQFADALDSAIQTTASTSTDRYLATLTRNERVTPHSHFQDVRLLEFQLDNRPFEPGDILDIMPENLESDVNDFLEHTGLVVCADRPFRFRETDPEHRLPSALRGTLTLRDLCRRWLDVFSIPRRSFFEFAAHFTKDPEHAEKLREFNSAAGQDDLYAYCHRMRRTTFEVLQDFRSIEIPLDYLLDVFPLLRPRQFSIASSPTMYPDRVHLLMGVVKYRTRLSTPRTGVCTRWIAQLDPTKQVSVGFRQGTMRLPTQPVPIVLIAPGLGVAPMRSLLQKRIECGQHDNILIFGCRHHAADYYCADEWEQMCGSGMLQLFTAFSRDQDEKRYVQHAIREQAQVLWAAIHTRGGAIYLCGKSTRMPEDVAEALCDVFAEQGGMSLSDAKAYLQGLKRVGRFQQECWD
ncbi:hypothetical protein THASP1DRAFT_15816 [Thamnocephalis sphaerospora]|uniref:NADPH-dependent diflavin oxidoreductase 1 n=1 Tax=Thamnocephalis sphaerospora TaxID=78915 RepID=A0A4P9XQY7_9FUNG|nr:hypothetical protein THASP1DRAFT_15816 [Thamnocephalis sphaerospora]|eukprot:RKP08332.1 hypothetical protein THASP1DRAFT_15816 [Thamnocephalis sphaerospora]